MQQPASKRLTFLAASSLKSYNSRGDPIWGSKKFLHPIEKNVFQRQFFVTSLQTGILPQYIVCKRSIGVLLMATLESYYLRCKVLRNHYQLTKLFLAIILQEVVDTV